MQLVIVRVVVTVSVKPVVAQDQSQTTAAAVRATHCAQGQRADLGTNLSVLTWCWSTMENPGEPTAVAE